MAQHVWSVLCEKMLTDEVNIVSLVGTIEKVIIHDKLETLEDQLKGAGGFVYPMKLITWCVRSDYAQPEAFDLRARWLSPAGEYIPLGQSHVSLENINGARIRSAITGIPWRGAGLYWLVIDTRVDGKEEWISAARLPVEVEVQDPDEGPESGTES